MVGIVAAALLCATGSQSLGPTPPKNVRRVVTLAPSLTDTVIALGGQALLVGVSRFDERSEVAKLPRVGGFVDPSVEAVLALKPDLLLVQPGPGNRKPVETLAAFGVPVLALPMHTVTEALAAMREVGKVLGRSKEADEQIREVERIRAQVRERAAKRAPRRVLLIYGFEPLVVAGPGTFAHELLQDVGAINAADKATSPYPVYSMESAVKARADVVINAAMVSRGIEKMSSLPGLKDARWLKIPSPALMQPGPGLGRALLELESMVFGIDQTGGWP